MAMARRAHTNFVALIEDEEKNIQRNLAAYDGVMELTDGSSKLTKADTQKNSK
jgi:hypothetical protein